MSYRVIIGELAAGALKDMDEATAELFFLAMVDLSRDPHSQGPELRREGFLTDRAHALGALNTILYTVDDSEANAVYITEVLWFD